MELAKLLTLLPPPATPINVPSARDWNSVETYLGVCLPTDYKDFVEIYGTGKIDNFIIIFNPISGNEQLDILRQLAIQKDVLIELKLFGENIPYDIFPAPGGILPLGRTDNGDILYWKTNVNLSWSIVLNEARGPVWECFNVSFLEFLVGFLAGKILCKAFPDDVPSQYPRFSVAS